jgi:transposase
MVSPARFVGLDAGRESIEASVRPSGEMWTANGGEDGMAEIVDTVFDIHPRLVVMQANGNFELPLAGMLMTRELPIALVQPQKVREFARAIGRLSRVEQRPAALLAQFAEFVRPETATPSGELVDELKHLRARRQEILQMIALERSRSPSKDHFLEKELQAHLQFLDKSLAFVDAQFSRKVRVSPVWH